MKRKKVSEHVTGNTFIDIHGNRYDITKAHVVEGQTHATKNERTDKNKNSTNNTKSKNMLKERTFLLLIKTAIGSIQMSILQKIKRNF